MRLKASQSLQCAEDDIAMIKLKLAMEEALESRQEVMISVNAVSSEFIHNILIEIYCLEK